MKEYNYPIVEVDTHTHTIISGHAWSSLTENVASAKARGMKGLCLTEHGPALIGGAPEYTPHSQRMVPPEVDELFASLTPMTSPCILTSAPPLFPELMAASVWIRPVARKVLVPSES